MHDAGCICHLADLAVKAGVRALPVDIDQLFIVIFSIAARKNRNLMIYGLLCMHTILTISCTTCWLSLLRCVHRYATH